MTVKEKIESLIEAANTATGESATDLTAAVQDLVDGYGGETGYYATYGGLAYYKRIMNFPCTDLPILHGSTYLEEIHAPNLTRVLNNGVRDCPNLRVFDAPNITSLWATLAFADCSSLTELYFPKTEDMGASACFGWTTALQTIQFGSIGHAVPNTGFNVFVGDYQSDLTITVYVADDAVLPYANAPWGAVNATIIYRSATTGEVLTP